MSIELELLQEIGLNKYEAEAYYTLLAHGPLTGYELGKRSQVPLSRGYDVLERLSQKGLALVQPGEPARYKALAPALFLGQIRSTMEQTLRTLASTLPTNNLMAASEEFWVIRGRSHILERARLLCETATRSVHLTLPQTQSEKLAQSLVEARQRGCEITHLTTNTTNLLLLVDTREALLGTLMPEENCQAIVSANPALLATAGGFFSAKQASAIELSVEDIPALALTEPRDWLEWEKRKQQRLWGKAAQQRSA